LALFLALSLVDLIRLFKYCGGKVIGRGGKSNPNWRD